MSARQVHAVLAAGVEDPRLIALWRDDPQALLRHGVAPEAIDLAALWKFAGLTVKVRHNGLRADLPLTFRLMNVTAVEIDLFASYASYRAARGEGYAATTEARTRDLVDFLDRWVDPSRHEHALLWDLIRHEHALAQLARMTGPPSAGADAAEERPVSRRPTGASVPRVRGNIILHEMRCDPRKLEDLLRRRSPPLDEVRLDSHRFCYWRPESASEIRILELDEFGYCALSLADGARSANELARAMGVSRGASRGFLTLLDRLGQVGILAFDAGRRSGAA
jgi:hypothetical protein